MQILKHFALSVITLALAVVAVQAEVLVPTGSTWKYLTGGINPSPTWTNLTFNDIAWDSGPAPLGDNLEGGVQMVTTVIDIGPVSRYPAVVFRKQFVVTNALNYIGLTVRLQRDDGAAVYLNGVEIVRDGLQAGAALTDYTTLHVATGADETKYYVFSVPVGALVSGTNILAAEVHNNAFNSSDLAFDLELIGEQRLPLVVVNQFPAVGSQITSLTSVEVAFSEAAFGVDAFDLLVNGAPATNLVVVDPAQFIFQFPQPAPGTVQITFNPINGIQSAGSDPLVNTNWYYLLDTNVSASPPIISEFMAANNHTLRDEDGDCSDWIELANTNSTTIRLLGYHLSAQSGNLVQWTFPDVAMSPHSYLVVFASGKNRTVAGRQLHTNFKLKAAGDYLALAATDGTNIIQQFAPIFPPQTNDISYGFFSPGMLDYMETPTPGAANVPTHRVASVAFSVGSGTFVSPFSLVITSATPGAVIYYTVNGADPTTNSLVYSNPIPINATVQIRAFGAMSGLSPSVVITAAYLQIDATAQSFSSDLPIIVLDSFGAGIVQSAAQPVYLMSFEPDPRTGRASLTNTPAVAMRAGLKIRGSASAGFPKHQFKLELWDEYDEDEHVPLLGLPSESDWVLNGDYTDESLIRNRLVYDFARDIGLEAPRTRFSEVFLHTSGGVVRGTLTDTSTTSYYGVLNLIEFIKIGKNRVDIDPLGPNDNTEPNVTGGYVLRFEKDATQGPVLSGWRTLELADPSTPTTNQLAWISSYMNTFRSVVMGENYRNPTNGFRAYIDQDSVVNYMLVNELTHNQDAYIRSAYKWKPRGGKLVEGPLWDYNTSFGISCCFDSWRTNNWTYTANPTGDLYWNIPESDRTTTNGAFPMYERFLSDPDFSQLWVDRYQELRQTLLRQDLWNARVDGYAAQVAEAQTRNFTRWTTLGAVTTSFENGLANFINISTETWPILVQQIKDWSRSRLLWMDAQFPAPVGFSRNSGAVPAGTSLVMTNNSSQAIYYTVDGSDPRASGGGLAPAAIRLSGSGINLTTSATVVARSFGLANNYGVTNWSRPTVAHFYITSQPAVDGNLIVTELNYHPAPPTSAEFSVNTNLTADDFEFIELRNIGTNTIDLFQVRFTNGINFNFTMGSVESLPPGQFVLVVKNRAAFELRYGAGRPIAGEFAGDFNNAGERITLVDWQGIVIVDYTYQDGWYPTVDGLGFTLVAARQDTAIADVSERVNWRFSADAGGSPGRADAAPAFSSVVVNEILAFPMPPALDTIELFNPTASAVDISGWFLTDNRQVPNKFRIPDGTSIESGGFLVFDESQFNPAPGGAASFGLSSQGEEVWLFAADGAGNLTGYAHGFQFGSSAPGVSFGRYLTSTGDEEFAAQTHTTFGASNSGPRVGPVIITEICYHPAPGGIQFVELKNIAPTNVALFDLEYPTNTWKLTGVGFDFSTNVILAPNEYLLLVATNVEDFRAAYSIPQDVRLFGPWTGSLQPNGELLELQYPRPPYSNGVDYVTLDVVRYNDKAPWPIAADGGGPSLHRILPSAYGNDPIQWMAAAPSPGASAGAGASPAITLAPVSQIAIAGRMVSLAAAAAGGADLRFQWRFNGNGIPGATQPLFVISNVQLWNAGDYTFVAYNAAGATAAPPARLTVWTPPRIVQQPLSVSVLAGNNSTFSVVASGTSPLRYQWRFGGVDILGQTNSTLLITNAQWFNEGAYTAVVADEQTFTLSDAATLAVFSKPIIIEQPLAQTAVQGDTVTLTVRVAGTPPFAFRWRRGSTVLVPFGSGADTLLLANVQSTNAGNYNVSITNAAPGGSLIISANAALTVLADSDGDHVPDLWMMQYFGHTNGLVADQSRALDDADGDGFANWQEYRAGTNPTNAASYLRLEAGWRGDKANIHFQGVAGRRYGLDGLDSLGLTNWITITNWGVSTNSEVLFNDSTATNNARFYRLRLMP